MKHLSYEEYADRVRVVNDAYRIFSGLTGNNIEKSFKAYQLILSERTRRPLLTSREHGDRCLSLFDAYVLPECPECGKELLPRPVNAPKGPQNRFGYQSCWECRFCGHETYSRLEFSALVKDLPPKPLKKEKSS